jgi:hypothetical protein
MADAGKTCQPNFFMKKQIIYAVAGERLNTTLISRWFFVHVKIAEGENKKTLPYVKAA